MGVCGRGEEHYLESRAALNGGLWDSSRSFVIYRGIKSVLTPMALKSSPSHMTVFRGGISASRWLVRLADHHINWWVGITEAVFRLNNTAQINADGHLKQTAHRPDTGSIIISSGGAGHLCPVFPGSIAPADT